MSRVQTPTTKDEPARDGAPSVKQTVLSPVEETGSVDWGAALKSGSLPSRDDVAPSKNADVQLRYAQEAWEPARFTTNPAEHSPEKFCYMVHMLNLGEGRTAENAVAILQRNPIVSTSIINEKKHQVVGFNTLGFIVQAPGSSVVAAAPHDMSIRNELFISTGPRKSNISRECVTTMTDFLPHKRS